MESENKQEAGTRTNPNDLQTGSQRIYGIDGQPQVETIRETEQREFLELLESKKSGRILTGIVSGIEQAKGHTMAMLAYGSYKVLIPYEFFMPKAIQILTYDESEEANQEVAALMNRRLGSEVDFIVEAMEEDVVIGNRLRAMQRRRVRMLLATREGEYRLKAGDIVECRIVAVRRDGLFAEIFGCETFIPLRDLAYRRIQDATKEYAPGERRLAKIMAITRDEENREVEIMASIKAAGKNPMVEGINRYNVGQRYLGVVSMIDANGVFVTLDNSVDCLCAFPSFGRRPVRGTRVTVKITLIDKEALRIFGVLTYISPRD